VRKYAGILIGGRSQRMGEPKALIEYDGVSLIEHTIATIQPAVDYVVLIGSHLDYDLPAACHRYSLLPDAVVGIGPLGGLATLLNQCDDDDLALMLACDMPYVSAELVTRLTQACLETDTNYDAVVPTTPNSDAAKRPRHHPCCALYRPSCLRAIEQAIEERRYSMMRLLSQLRVTDLPLDHNESRWLTNWNTPDDLPD